MLRELSRADPKGYFSGDGNIMNLTVTLTPSARGCSVTDIRGEMRR